MRPHLAALALVLVAASPAAAQDEIDCNNAMAQQDMNACAAKDYEAADAETQHRLEGGARRGEGSGRRAERRS